MKRLLIVSIAIFASIASGRVAVAQSVPGGVEVACDVDRPTFRHLARDVTDVTFRLWDAETGGSQCGPDYVVPVSDLMVFKRYSDRIRTADSEALQPRKVLRISAVLGSDASPVELCSGSENWVDVSVGTTTMTCDFSAQSPKARRRLYAVPIAESGGSGGVSQVDSGFGLQGGPITSTGTISVNAPTCTGTDKLIWDGTGFQCAADQTGGSGTVTSVGSGSGLTGGTITGSGSLSVDAPICSGTDKLVWTGAAFACSADQDSGGTVTGVATGAGLSGGPISTSGTISINAPTCSGTDKLTWSGSAFQCVPDQVGSTGASFGGDGTDGALAISSGTTTLDLEGAAVVVKNYISVSITGAGQLAFSNPHPNGTIILLRVQNDFVLTSTADPAIDLEGLGAAGGAGATVANSDDNSNGHGAGGGGGASIVNPGSAGANGGPSTGNSGVGGNWSFGIGRITGGGGGAGASGGKGGIELGLNVAFVPLSHAYALMPGAGGGGGGTSGDDACCSQSFVAGSGGRGGGSLIVECAGSLNFTGVISAHGQAGTSAQRSFDGCGGGGGGGSVLILYNTLASNSGTIDTGGGLGGVTTCAATGGNGGNGFSVISRNTTF